MPQYSMVKAKAELSQLIEQALRGEDVVLTRRGKPVARIVPITAERRPPAGLFASEIAVADDAFSTETDRRVAQTFGVE
jgi:prevent-host-death family protein